MRHPAYPDSVCDISEKDFWRSMRAPEGAKGKEHLEAAIRLGKAGKKARAYAALASYHRAALADEWKALRDEALKGEPPSAQQVRDVLCLKVPAWHRQVVRFRGKVDWSTRSVGVNGFYGFHYLSWLRPVVRAFLHDLRPKHRRFLIALMTDYYRARNKLDWPRRDLNPVYYELGVAAKHRLCIELYLGFINTGPVPTATAEAMLKLLMGFGRSMHVRLKDWRAHNIHTAGTVALLRIARTFPEFSESPVWDRQAVRYVLRHVRESFLPDGGHIERTWGYGHATLEKMTDLYLFLERAGGLGSAQGASLRKLREAYRWFAKTLGPGDMIPSFGDSGLYAYPRILEAGRPLFPDRVGRYFDVDRSRSYLLRPSGFAVMRNGDDERSAYVNLTFGRFAGWHSHFDLLSMNLWALGKPLLEELGRFGPYDHGLDPVFRAAPSHNQVLVDEYHYDCRGEGARDVFWHSDDAVDYFSAYHRAYRYVQHLLPARGYSMSAHLRVWRTVVFVKDPGYAVVLDSVQDESHPQFGRAVTAHWHSPRPFKLLAPGVARTQGLPACLLMWARPGELTRMETGVDYSPADGAGDSRHHLRAGRWGPVNHTGCIGFVTLLYPFKGKAPKVEFRILPVEGGGRWRTEGVEVRTPRGRDVFVLNPERLGGVKWRGKAFRHRALIRLGGRKSVRVD